MSIPTDRPDSIRDEDLLAFRLFCESVYQPSAERIATVLAHDWSEWPRLDRTLRSMPRPVTQEALAAVALQLLGEAVSDLAGLFPPRAGHVTPLEVFELHVLERRSWPSVQAMLSEQGRPHARGTLIRRQHDLLPYLLRWTREGALAQADAAAPATAAELPIESGPRRRRTARVWTLAIAVPLLAAAGVGFALQPDWRRLPGTPEEEPAAWVLRAELRGRRVPGALSAGQQLPDPYPPLRLPDIDGERLVVMPLEERRGEPRLLYSYERAADPAPVIGLWDPGRLERIWETSFEPPAEDRLTHEGVGPEVLDESYWVTNMFHDGRQGDLGAYAALVLVQKYSPCFVVFLRIESGAVDGYYVNPGYLQQGLVCDLDQDGHCELILAGQDNTLDLPAVVALAPGPGRIAASTVAWNSSGEEQALYRVLLPDWPEARRAQAVARLEVCCVEARAFDPSSGTLSVGVGNGNQTLYHARLGPGLVPDSRQPLILWDPDRVNIQGLGLVEPDLEAMAEDIQVIKGRGGA